MFFLLFIAPLHLEHYLPLLKILFVVILRIQKFIAWVTFTNHPRVQTEAVQLYITVTQHCHCSNPKAQIFRYIAARQKVISFVFVSLSYQETFKNDIKQKIKDSDLVFIWPSLRKNTILDPSVEIGWNVCWKLDEGFCFFFYFLCLKFILFCLAVV